MFFDAERQGSDVPLEAPARIVDELTSRGYNVERSAVTLLAGADDPARAIERTLEAAPGDALVLTEDHVRTALAASTDESESSPDPASATGSAEAGTPLADDAAPRGSNPSVSTGATQTDSTDDGDGVPVETRGSSAETGAAGGGPDAAFERSVDPELRSVTVDDDMTGASTGTGRYEDFVSVFRDRYQKLSSQLRGRVNHRPASSIESMAPGSDVATVGMVDDIRSTASGHWLVDLEDTSGTFPWLVMKDKDVADAVEELLLDEVIAVEGTLSDDAGIAFVDAIHFPDVPRTYSPSTADRAVEAALISDVHVGSQEFMRDAWERFADWLHGPEAATVEYLLIAGDMVEGVGVYPDQDEELDVVDIYEQYERFSELLELVPGDMDIRMIPGNHDAVRLAEPQPGFDEELRSIMSAHDASIHSNPSTVTVEGVSVLMYHGVSLDELIAKLPEEKASYEQPHRAMYRLLKKRHVAPKYGGHMRLAPEEQDYLVIDDVPDVFHTGHVHKLGWGKYHNVLAVNSGCWQAQTAFQESVDIDPDAGYAPILDLQNLELTVRKFS
jgi:DNA polymerase II small subunit